MAEQRPVRSQFAFGSSYVDGARHNIRRWTKRRGRGRPTKTDEHRQWAEVFRRLDDELNDGDRYDEKLNSIEISQLVVDELGLNVTARAVWNAVKRVR